MGGRTEEIWRDLGGGEISLVLISSNSLRMYFLLLSDVFSEGEQRSALRWDNLYRCGLSP